VSDVERLFRHIVIALHEADPARLREPLMLHELMGRVLPYKVARRALGVDSSEDFELLVLRLAGGEGGFVQTEPEPVQVRFAEEAVSVNPNLDVLREFRDARLRLGDDAAAWILAGHSSDELFAPPPEPAAPAPLPAPEPSVPAPPPTLAAAPSVPPSAPPPTAAPAPPAPRPAPVVPPAAARPPIAPAAAPAAPVLRTRCDSCGGRLPSGRVAHFCPQCGQSQEPAACPHCSEEVASGWRFCIACGGELGWQA
jgi:hypothetical protein